MKQSNINELYEVYQTMLTNKLVMIYEGEFSQEIVKSVLSMAEKNFEQENIDTLVRKKIFNVMVESLQNICKHQYAVKNTDNTNIPAIFMIGMHNEQYNIITGNLILNDNINPLKDKLDTINSLNPEELKQYYKEARLKSTISDVGGAGLGFIDMVRKANNKLNYQFENINNQTSFFTLSTIINNIKDEN